jgi:RES domain-containing protein
MRIWRIARNPHRALDGEGARLAGGRWSSEGVPVVYASSTLALAALEYLVHVDIEDVPDDLVALGIDVSDDVPAERVEPGRLPEGWNRVTDHPACVAAGDRWLAAGAALLLSVPSALIPKEENVLLNPAHPAAQGVSVDYSRRFVFDPRLL